MNAEDAKLSNQNISRLAYTQHRMMRVIKTSPCGTHVSIAVFTVENITLFIPPLEE